MSAFGIGSLKLSLNPHDCVCMRNKLNNELNPRLYKTIEFIHVD